jgi:hypothetical protein
MSDHKIEPALSAEEWQFIDAALGDNFWQKKSRAARLDHTIHEATTDGSGEAKPITEYAKVIAAANAALPDSDPRRITRERLEMLRQHSREVDLAEWADALESYLPSEK